METKYFEINHPKKWNVLINKRLKIRIRQKINKEQKLRSLSIIKMWYKYPIKNNITTKKLGCLSSIKMLCIYLFKK